MFDTIPDYKRVPSVAQPHKGYQITTRSALTGLARPPCAPCAPHTRVGLNAARPEAWVFLLLCPRSLQEICRWPLQPPFSLVVTSTGQACQAATCHSATTLPTPGHQELKERPRESPGRLAHLVGGSASGRKDRCGWCPGSPQAGGLHPVIYFCVTCPACIPRAFRCQAGRVTLRWSANRPEPFSLL